jgi:hypothetical protein
MFVFLCIWRACDGLSIPRKSPAVYKIDNFIIKSEWEQLRDTNPSGLKKKKQLQGCAVRARMKATMGKPRRRWEENIKLGLRERGRGRMAWFLLASDRNKRWGSYKHANENSVSIK